MKREQIENLCQLTAHLALSRASPGGHGEGSRNLPNMAAASALNIHKYARELSKLAELDCNQELTRSQRSRVVVLETRTNVLLETYGLTATFSGDPRGYVVKILGLPGNTWGGDSEGFGVG